LPIKLGMGGALGRGSQWQSWIHVQDVLRGIAHLWKAASTESLAGAEVFNFTAPEVLSQKQFGQVAARVLHRPCFMPTPAWPMRLALGEQADLLLEGQRVVPKRLLDSGFDFTYPDLEAALRSVV